VWVEVEDIEGQKDSAHNWITVTSINQPPVAEFTFTPDKPIIGEKVKFNASVSYDPDGGTIINYRWDFGDGNFEFSNTPYINHIYIIDGPHIVKLNVSDDENTSSEEYTKIVNVVTDWSYAIITDLHIGRGYPEYNREDYYLIERLEKTIDEILSIKDENNIKFVVVLGDLSENGKLEELKKARDILDILNDPNGNGNTDDGLPYFPVIGNHDVLITEGDRINFTTVFNNEFFTKQFEILKIEESQWELDSSEYVNYAFFIGNLNFISLDFVRNNFYGLSPLGRNGKTIARFPFVPRKSISYWLYSRNSGVESIVFPYYYGVLNTIAIISSIFDNLYN